MAYVKFYKGLSTDYIPETHQDGIYQCTDTGDTYIFGVLNSGVKVSNYDTLDDYESSEDKNDDEVIFIKNERQIKYKGQTYYCNNNNNYVVAEWSDDPLEVDAVDIQGNINFASDWHYVLLDMTDNSVEGTRPVGFLMDNNPLRFEDGSFAPVVGITETRRAECDVELYLDSGHLDKYCNAGSFNAETFYNEHGMAKLYDINGNSVHVLRPWETTETKYSIGICRKSTIYVMDKQKGASGKIWSGIFTNPTTWDGIVIDDKYKLVPTAMFAHKCCTIDNKMRSFYYLFEADNANCKSNATTTGVDVVGTTRAVFPRTTDISQITNKNLARANNIDSSSSLPFAEGGFAVLNAFVLSLEIMNKTKNISGIYGSGSSSNDLVTTETAPNVGGLIANDSTAYNFNSSINGTDVSQYLTNYKPLMPCMEAIIASAYANERAIQDGEWFELYDCTFKRTTVRNDGLLNSILIKRINYQDGDNNYTLYIRSSITNGSSLAGDVWCYFGGGYEQIGTCLNATQDSTGNTVDVYFKYDQSKWVNEDTISKNDLGKFDFEDSYNYAGQFTDISDG